MFSCYKTSVLDVIPPWVMASLSAKRESVFAFSLMPAHEKALLRFGPVFLASLSARLRNYTWKPVFKMIGLPWWLTQYRICLQCRPGLESWFRRSPGEGNGYPPQYSCLESSMVRGNWQAAVHGVAKSRALLVQSLIPV